MSKPKPFSRRSFLRSSSAVTASVVLVAAGLPVAVHADRSGTSGPASDSYTNNTSRTVKVRIEVTWYNGSTVVATDYYEDELAPGKEMGASWANTYGYSWKTKIIVTPKE